MCRSYESTSIQIKTMTQQEVSAVSTRPSTSKQHRSADQRLKQLWEARVQTQKPDQHSGS